MKNWKVVTEDGKKGVELRTIDRELHENPATAYGAESKHDKDGNVIETTVPEKRVIPFADPGKRTGSKRLYTIKAEKRDGTLIQIPLEDQINNNVASPENAIGLQLYARRGINVFFDFETGEGAFCPTWDCWAQWNSKLDGFCSEEHRHITKGNEEEGRFGSGATTSRTWG